MKKFFIKVFIYKDTILLIHPFLWYITPVIYNSYKYTRDGRKDFITVSYSDIKEWMGEDEADDFNYRTEEGELYTSIPRLLMHQKFIKFLCFTLSFYAYAKTEVGKAFPSGYDSKKEKLFSL